MKENTAKRLWMSSAGNEIIPAAFWNGNLKKKTADNRDMKSVSTTYPELMEKFSAGSLTCSTRIK